MKKETYRQRTYNLETIKFALGHGYSDCPGNLFAVRHFDFVYTGAGSPAIKVRWYKGNTYPCVSIGNTQYNGNASDKHALEHLKKFW